jgi:hypothetical protein
MRSVGRGSGRGLFKLIRLDISQKNKVDLGEISGSQGFQYKNDCIVVRCDM